MKIRNKKLVFIIGVFLFLITPFFGFVSFAKAQTAENSFIFGAVDAGSTDWDPATSEADLMAYMKFNTMESLLWEDSQGNLHPLLAESWTVHQRPDGVSATGPNEGGIAAYEFKLQEGVTFHDGSEFNASVAKWNIDRIIQISGYENRQWATIHWMNPASYKSRFIPTWNLSWAINDPEVSLIETDDPAIIDDGDYINYTSRTGVNDGETADYYIWFDKTCDSSADPAPACKTSSISS